MIWDTLRKLEAETAQRLYKKLDDKGDLLIVKAIMVLLAAAVSVAVWQVFR